MRVDTTLGSTYWEDNKLLSMHANAIAQEREQVLKDIYEFADSFIFMQRRERMQK